MITKAQRQEAFLKELQALLNKHGAELEATESDESYGMHRGVTNISMAGVWDADDACVAEFVEFDLPTYMYPTC